MQTESGPAGSLIRGKEVHVIGAGVSGLLISYYLKKAGHKVTVFEKEKVGGKIQTEITEAGPAEKAANAIYTSSEVMELLSELKLTPLSPAPNLKKKIWRFSRPLNFPLRLMEVVKILFRLFKRPPAQKDISVLDFFSPLLGKETAYEILSAVFGGVYAANADELDFESIFKESPDKKSYLQFFKAMAKNKKRERHRAQSISFKNGMQDFIEALKEELSDSIEHKEIFELDRTVNTVLCCEADAAARILARSAPEVSKELEKIKYKPLSTGTYFLKKPLPELHQSFGILFPPKSGFNSLGILHNNAIFENRTFVENVESYTFISHSQEDHLRLVMGDCVLLSNGRQSYERAVLTQEQTAWKKGVPLYDVQRRKAMAEIRARLDGQPGVVLFGNYVDGISIREMIRGAKNFAAKSI